MNRVEVNARVLRWALERSELSGRDLGNRFPQIKEWLSGKNQPTLRQLESLSKATLTPFGFFFLKEPPEERMPIPHFRTHKEDVSIKPSPELLETIRIMQQRQSWMKDFLIEQGREKLQFVNSARIDEKPATIAQSVRNTLGFADRWAAHAPTWTDALNILRIAIEKVGILVVTNGILGNNTHRKLEAREFRGFVLVDEYAPLIFVNNADAKAAQMFTLAHEIAHVFFGSSAAFDLREMMPADDDTERACNRVAAEFLVPESELRSFWTSVCKEPECFEKIAYRFKVSILVAARRALDLELINRDKFFEFYQNYMKTQRRIIANEQKGGDFYANQNLRLGKRFALNVLWAAKEGKLLYSEAYKLTGLYGKAFDGYARYLGIGAFQ